MIRCELCQVRFRTHWGLRQHMVALHPETVTHRCRVCSTPYSNRADLDRHVAMEGHYSGSTSPRPTVNQIQSQVETSIPSYYTAQPKVRSAIVIPHKDLPTSSSRKTTRSKESTKAKTPTGKTSKVSHSQHTAKPYGEKSSTKTGPKGSLSGYTIPKKSRVTPDQPSYSGRKPTATVTNSDSKECTPTGINSVTPPAAQAEHFQADLLADVDWLASLLKKP